MPPPGSPSCSVSAYGVLVFTHLYLFFTVAIAYNLHRIFVKRRPYNREVEIWLWVLPPVAALIAALPALWADKLGYDAGGWEYCWFRESWTPEAKAWEWASYLIWACACIGYCTVVIVRVLFRLRDYSGTISRYVTRARQERREDWRRW